MKYEIGLSAQSEGKPSGVVYVMTPDDPIYENPALAGKEVYKLPDVLKACYGYPDEAKRQGFMQPCNHPECPAGTTLWEHVLHHASMSKIACPELHAAVGSPLTVLGKPIPIKIV
jgi:hypothetical protein